MSLFCIVSYSLLKHFCHSWTLILSPICLAENASCYQMPAAKQKKNLPNLAFNNFCPWYVFVTFLLSFSLSALTGLIPLLSRLDFADEIKELKNSRIFPYLPKIEEDRIHTTVCTRALEKSYFLYQAQLTVCFQILIRCSFFSFRWAYLENLFSGKVSTFQFT